MGWLIASVFCGIEVFVGIGMAISASKDSMSEVITSLIVTAFFGYLSYCFMKKYKKYKSNKGGNNKNDVSFDDTETNNVPIKKKPKVRTVIIALLFIIIFSIVLVESSKKGKNINANTENNEENIIVDVSKFSKITPEQLTEIMGKPESKEEWNFESSNGKVYPTTTYTYKNGDYEFLVIDGKVVEMNIYGSEANKMSYTDEDSIFGLFGITPADTILKVGDTGVALRYESVTNSIDDFWVTIDSDKKILNTVKIMYDRTYFGDLPRMAMSSSDQIDLKIRCENGVKEALKSPSTAKFPNIDEWYFGKDKEKIVVQSYVDAQNSFGAMLRSKFQVTFTPDGDTVTSFIFDGKEYMKK